MKKLIYTLLAAFIFSAVPLVSNAAPAQSSGTLAQAEKTDKTGSKSGKHHKKKKKKEKKHAAKKARKNRKAA